MRANPGGEIDPEDVIGRDQLIWRLWDVLQNQSVVLVAERRIGKTTVVKKMRSAAREDTRLIYHDVEGVRTPLDFAEQVAKDVESCLTGVPKAKFKLRHLLKHLAGFELAGVLKFPPGIQQQWKSLLEAGVEDLIEHGKGMKWVFIWDELPVMLQKIRENEGERTAVDVLDTLRSLRQTHSRLRMIYTGSVGLHHVVSGVYNAGTSNDPTNDMRFMEVTELLPEDGKALARALIEGEGLHCADIDTSTEAITSAVDHVPFYIHQVVAGMKDLGQEAGAGLADTIVLKALTGAQDPWHFKHYRKRLDTYYAGERIPVILKLLDELAVTRVPLTFTVLARRLRSTIPRETAGSEFVNAVLDGDDEKLRDLLKLLEQDHYVARESGTADYRFRFPLIQRWWKLDRSLR